MQKAQTGSGKTASFTFPYYPGGSSKQNMKGKPSKVLVLTPTRELALQVSKNFEEFFKIFRKKSQR